MVLISNEDIMDKIKKGILYNCKEVLIMSGEKAHSFREVKDELRKRNYNDFIDFILDISKKLLDSKLLPHTNIGILAYNELKHLKNYNASIFIMLLNAPMSRPTNGDMSTWGQSICLLEYFLPEQEQDSKC